MPNNYQVYLDDIISSIKNIESYTKGLSYDAFSKNRMMSDAVIRNLEIIGEAVKRLPLEIKKTHTEIEWKKMAGLRDVLVHEYSGIDMNIVWDIVVNKLPQLKISINKIK